MSGIEKICEVTGEHFGWEMYRWKDNLIQVKPEARKYFHDKKGYLLFFEDPETVNFIDDPPHPLLPLQIFGKRFYIPRFWKRFYWQWRDVGMFYRKPSLQWNYCLYVPTVPGKVKGEYWNWTSNPEKTLNNLGKLVKELEVESVPVTLEKWKKTQSSENQSMKRWFSENT